MAGIWDQLVYDGLTLFQTIMPHDSIVSNSCRFSDAMPGVGGIAFIDAEYWYRPPLIAKSLTTQAPCYVPSAAWDTCTASQDLGWPHCHGSLWLSLAKPQYLSGCHHRRAVCWSNTFVNPGMIQGTDHVYSENLGGAIVPLKWARDGCPPPGQHAYAH